MILGACTRDIQKEERIGVLGMIPWGVLTSIHGERTWEQNFVSNRMGHDCICTTEC